MCGRGSGPRMASLAHKLRFYDRWAPDYDQARGFIQLHGVDGSPSMLERAQARGLYQHLSLCTLGQEPLPSSEGRMVCLTTRANPSNLRYKEALEATLDRLEQARAWEHLVAWPVDQWELATSELELVPGTSDSDGFISGIIYLYQKQKATQSRE